ncbi:hypothetical protein LJK88_29985 [Paenibacillus sp. P26]|nr:hypothetical protein LJK88_29985 [Paenibacillus sp. P26]
MFAAQDWKDYELIDTGEGEKLERWGTIVLRRPDPQIIWPLVKETGAWRSADAHYHRSSSGGGNGNIRRIFRSGGRSLTRGCPSTLSRRALSIRGCSPSRRSTGAG